MNLHNYGIMHTYLIFRKFYDSRHYNFTGTTKFFRWLEMLPLFPKCMVMILQNEQTIKEDALKEHNLYCSCHNSFLLYYLLFIMFLLSLYFCFHINIITLVTLVIHCPNTYERYTIKWKWYSFRTYQAPLQPYSANFLQSHNFFSSLAFNWIWIVNIIKWIGYCYDWLIIIMTLKEM